MGFTPEFRESRMRTAFRRRAVKGSPVQLLCASIRRAHHSAPESASPADSRDSAVSSVQSSSAAERSRPLPGSRAGKRLSTPRQRPRRGLRQMRRPDTAQCFSPDRSVSRDEVPRIRSSEAVTRSPGISTSRQVQPGAEQAGGEAQVSGPTAREWPTLHATVRGDLGHRPPISTRNRLHRSPSSDCRL